MTPGVKLELIVLCIVIAAVVLPKIIKSLLRATATALPLIAMGFLLAIGFLIARALF